MTRLANDNTQQPAAVAAPTRAPIGLGVQGVQLRTLDDMWRFAQYVKASGLAPKGLDHESKIVIALQYGAELGMPPMQSIQSICVINGRPSLWGDGFLAVCRAHWAWDEEKFEEVEVGTPGQDDWGFICRMGRRSSATVIERSFTVAVAKLAKLWGKVGKSGQPTPWVTYPKRMLQMRARGFCGRDAFTDALRGIRTAEEIMDMIDLDATEENIQKAKRRIKPPRSTDEPTPAEPPPATVDEMVENLDVPPEEADAPEPEPKPAPPKNPPNTISEAQRKRLFAILKNAGKTTDQLKSYLAPMGITSTTLITKDQYENICLWCAAPDAQADLPAVEGEV